MTDDILGLIDAVRREVRSGERDGKATKTVVLSRTYDTSVEDLWDAVSNAERLPRWFAPVTGELRLGGRYQVQGNAGGTITRCEPPHELAMTWEFGGGVSWVEVSLRPDGERATLELRHIAHPEEHWDKFGPGAVGVGWELGLMGLARHFEDRSAIRPAEAADDWHTTDDGKLFMRKSAEGWSKADAGGGEDGAKAAERAERTRKFYSGEA
jgi:uncharacterized protein YndB with AHSA1/START domain